MDRERLPPPHLPNWRTIRTNGRSLLLAPSIDLDGPPPPLPQPVRLKILHLNDLHGHGIQLTPTKYEPTMARVAGRLRHLHHRYASDPQTAVLFVSAGDEVAGSLFDELLDGPAISEPVHASYRLYSAAGLNAAALGNHDLDIGADRLAQAINYQANFPILSANLMAPPPLANVVHAAAILKLKGLQVGLIGLTTPAQSNCGQVAFTNPARAVQQLLPTIRPFCHVVILLSHLGYSLNSETAGVAVAGDVELAQQLPPSSVDLIVGGHTHLPLNEQGLSRRHVVNGIPIVQAGALGRFLGEVTLTGQERWVVTDARLTPTAVLPIDPTFDTTAVAPLVEQIRPHFTRPLGTTISHPDLSPEAVHNAFAAGESALANFITEGMVARARAHGLPADLALIDASVIRDGLPAGPLTFADWFALMPYADTLRLCRLTGRQLWALLQDNACRLDLPYEHHVERGFLHFSGHLRYTIQPGRNREENRVVAAQLNGRSLSDQLDGVITAVLPSFWRQLARSWQAEMGNLPLMPHTEFPLEDTGLFLRREMVAYIGQMGGVNERGGARQDGRLQILPLPQTTERRSWYEYRHVFHQPALS